MKRAVLPLVLACAGGCAIDTELGLAVTIEASSASVTSDGEGDLVAITMGVAYRVGEHAETAHEFQPQSVDVFVGEALVARASPNRPPAFVSLVRPGQSFTTTFTGETRPVTGADARALCGTEALLLLRWTDATTGEVGTSESTTADVTCD